MKIGNFIFLTILSGLCFTSVDHPFEKTTECLSGVDIGDAALNMFEARLTAAIRDSLVLEELGWTFGLDRLSKLSSGMRNDGALACLRRSFCESPLVISTMALISMTPSIQLFEQVCAKIKAIIQFDETYYRFLRNGLALSCIVGWMERNKMNDLGLRCRAVCRNETGLALCDLLLNYKAVTKLHGYVRAKVEKLVVQLFMPYLEFFGAGRSLRSFEVFSDLASKVVANYSSAESEYLVTVRDYEIVFYYVVEAIWHTQSNVVTKEDWEKCLAAVRWLANNCPDESSWEAANLYGETDLFGGLAAAQREKGLQLFCHACWQIMQFAVEYFTTDFVVETCEIGDPEDPTLD